MNIWILLITLAAVTLAERLSFILFASWWSMPGWLERGLAYVPVAVLSALVVPGLVRPDGEIHLSPLNPQLVAGVAAAIIAWRTGNVLLTIVLGMATFWGLNGALPVLFGN